MSSAAVSASEVAALSLLAPACCFLSSRRLARLMAQFVANCAALRAPPWQSSAAQHTDVGTWPPLDSRWVSGKRTKLWTDEAA